MKKSGDKTQDFIDALMSRRESPAVTEALNRPASPETAQMVEDEIGGATTNLQDYPSTCPICGSPAYDGLCKVECSNGDCE